MALINGLPYDQRLKKLYGLDPFKASKNLAKIFDHKHGRNGDIMFLLCYVSRSPLT